MRLLWARVGVPYSPATGLPIESQTVCQMADRILALRRARGFSCWRRWCAAARANTARNSPSSEEGLPARQNRRQILRDRRGAGARQEVHPRHRRRGRPHRGAARHRHPARGFARAGAQARRGLRSRNSPRPASSSPEGRSERARVVEAAARPRPAQCADPPGEEKDDEAATRRVRERWSSRKIRLPGLGLHYSRDRAAAVLVQQSVRRLPEMRRARRRAAHRRRPGRSRQGAHAAQGRHRAVGEIVLALLRADAAALGKHYKFTLDTKWKDLPKKTQDAILHGSGEDRDPLHLRRRHARLRHQAAVRRRHHQSRAPLPRDRLRLGARGDRALFHRRALRGLQRLPAQARSALRQDRRRAYRRSLATCRSRRGRAGSASCRQHLTAKQNEIAGAHPQGDPRAAEIPDRCRARLSDAGARLAARFPAAKASASGWPRRSAPA